MPVTIKPMTTMTFERKSDFFDDDFDAGFRSFSISDIASAIAMSSNEKITMK